MAKEILVCLEEALRPAHGPNTLSLSELRRWVVMVFKTPNPLPLSICKNMTMPLSLVMNMGKREAEAGMEQALIEAGL